VGQGIAVAQTMYTHINKCKNNKNKLKKEKEMEKEDLLKLFQEWGEGG
jgi:prefoldin subunit 5